MTVYVGADHRGFALKEAVKAFLIQKDHQVIDCGAVALEPDDDYVDFARTVAENMQKTQDSRGILICGSGVGMAVAANKIASIRASVIATAKQAQVARHDDDINVLSLASDFTSQEEALLIVDAFLSTPFAKEERFIRRLNKVKELELHG